jgi:hypothetical protein
MIMMMQLKVNFNDRKFKAWTTARQDFIRKAWIPQLSLRCKNFTNTEIIHYHFLKRYSFRLINVSDTLQVRHWDSYV